MIQTFNNKTNKVGNDIKANIPKKIKKKDSSNSTKVSWDRKTN
jgi:hypothetical protein